MTPHLVDALARLAPLGRAELALVSATATALMAQAALSNVPLTPTLPPLTIPESRAAPVEPGTDPLPRRPVSGRAKQDVRGGSVTPIGGPNLSLEPSPSFTCPEFLARWRPGRTVQVYLAGSRSLATLMRRLHRPDVTGARRLCAFKVGTHAGPDLGGRLRRLSAERYGSIWREGKAMIDDPLWGDWTVEPLNPGTAQASLGSPVRVGVESIEVVLPVTLTPAAFDQRLGTLLAPSTLARSRCRPRDATSALPVERIPPRTASVIDEGVGWRQLQRRVGIS